MNSGPKPLPTRGPGNAERASGRASGAFGSVGNRRLREVPLNAIEPNPEQPRKRFDPGRLELLAASLRERGLLQPVLVRPLADDRYELIAGERRWRAAQLAGLTHLAAFVRFDADDGTALELALTENAARQDLTVVEEARTFSALLDDLAVTQQVLAKRVGRSRPDLANTVRLLELPDAVLDLLDEGALSKGHGKALLVEPDPHRRNVLARKAAAEGWSVRVLERTIASATRRLAQQSVAAPDLTEATQRLAALLAGRVDAPVKVKLYGQRFRIEISAENLAHAEAVVARLVESCST